MSATAFKLLKLMNTTGGTQVQSLCRICLQKVKEDTNLFAEGNEENSIGNIIKKIYLCFQVTLSHDKYMPSLICNECFHDINIAYSLRLKCVTINDRLELYCKEQIERKAIRNEKECYNISNLDEDTTGSDLFQNYDPDSDDISFKNTEQAAKTEYENNTNELKNIFKCNICNKVLKTKITLLRHYVSMHEKRKHAGKVSGFGVARRYHCTSCSYSTPHSQTLVSHMRTHNGERPYSCECGKSFTQSSSLAAHRKTHSTTTYFTCTSCGKQFKHAFTLKNHMRVHETASFQCSVCFKSLKSKETLQAHMHRHYKICNYNCEDCGDTFVTSAELHNHRKKHSLEKKLKCHLCDYKTHTKKNLIIHLKRHTGNRTFKCDMCHVGFYTRSNLQRHLRVHTGDKPYSCPTCGQKFSYSPSLNKHMKIIHGVQYKWADWKETCKTC